MEKGDNPDKLDVSYFSLKDLHVFFLLLHLKLTCWEKQLGPKQTKNESPRKIRLHMISGKHLKISNGLLFLENVGHMQPSFPTLSLYESFRERYLDPLLTERT